MNNILKGARPLVFVISTFVIWEIVALILNTDFLPQPSNLLLTVYSLRSEYFPHVTATLSKAALGFILGTLLGCSVAVLVELIPVLEVVIVPSTMIFSIPLIILIPIIGMTIEPDMTPVVCAILLVYYPVVILVTAGLKSAPRSLLHYATSTGASSLMTLTRIRARYALPGLAAAFQAGIPAALLGSMLGEFTGARWGLGAYLLAVMAQANPSKEWGIFLTIAMIAGATTWFSELLWSRLGISALTISPFATTLVMSKVRFTSGLLLGVVLWELTSLWASNPFFVKSPADVLRYLLTFSAQDAGVFLSAMIVTLSWVGVGLLIGLLVGFVFAITLYLIPFLRGPLFVLVFITQAVPIVALVPLCVAVFGRGKAATIGITVLATFFLCFTGPYQALHRTPARLLDFALSAGASRLLVLWRLRIPSVVPFLFAAARVAAPRVFLGVTLAEYIITRQGLGAMLFEARGRLDFGLMWTIACCAGGTSILFLEGLAYLEQRAVSRYS